MKHRVFTTLVTYVLSYVRLWKSWKKITKIASNILVQIVSEKMIIIPALLSLLCSNKTTTCITGTPLRYNIFFAIFVKHTVLRRTLISEKLYCKYASDHFNSALSANDSSMKSFMKEVRSC